MSMGIRNDYRNYASSYTNTVDSNKKTSEINTESASTRKTAADELSYLSKKYSNYSFVAADYKQGMRYGSNKTTNVAISPEFLQKMANDPELEKQYEKEIASMQSLDEQFARSVEAGGWHVAAQGWAIDKNGGISSWAITQKDDKKSFLQTMSENTNKIQKQRLEQIQQAKVAQKRQASKTKLHLNKKI